MPTQTLAEGEHRSGDERATLVEFLRGQRLPKRYRSDAEPDGDFDGAVADQAIVEEAWAAWREEVSFADNSSATPVSASSDTTGTAGRFHRVSSWST
jgi:hypothetical protein